MQKKPRSRFIVCTQRLANFGPNAKKNPCGGLSSVYPPAPQILGLRSSASMDDKQDDKQSLQSLCYPCYSEDVWLCVFVHCSSQKLCQLSKTCRMFQTIAPSAATAKLYPTGSFSAELCDYLDDFGGKTSNDCPHPVPEMTISKLHETALPALNMLSIKLFVNIIKNEMQIHGVRLITDFYKRKVLLREEKTFTSSIKKLFYYETTLSKVMDLVMLQGILCDLFQKSVDNVTEFSSAQSPLLKTSLREKKIDGTNITQLLNSMMSWTETRSLMDELDEREYAIAWPPTSITHRMLQTMLGTKDYEDINFFMKNILKSIQLPFTSFKELKNNTRKFMLGPKSCNCNFNFLSGPLTKSDNETYLCMMDLTEGNVMCRGGRMSIKISISSSCQSTTEVAEGISRISELLDHLDDVLFQN